MKKSTAGIIAGAAGITLLAGGGTLALWADQEVADGGTITAGNLDIEALAPGSWSDVSSLVTDPTFGWDLADDVTDLLSADDTALGAAIADINDFLAVPGDLLEYSQAVGIINTGDNMTAQLSVDIESVVGAGLAPGVHYGIIVFDDSGATVGSASDTDTVTFNVPTTDVDGVTADDYTVKVRIGLDGRTLVDQVGTTETISLTGAGNGFAFTLEQYRPAGTTSSVTGDVR